jgi:hypothetical protein
MEEQGALVGGSDRRTCLVPESEGLPHAAEHASGLGASP